jgi:hypothetical protein
MDIEELICQRKNSRNERINLGGSEQVVPTKPTDNVELVGYLDHLGAGFRCSVFSNCAAKDGIVSVIFFF